METVWIGSVYEESPRLTYRARSRDTLGSNLEMCDETDESSPVAGLSSSARRASATGSEDPNSSSPPDQQQQMTMSLNLKQNGSFMNGRGKGEEERKSI